MDLRRNYQLSIGRNQDLRLGVPPTFLVPIIGVKHSKKQMPYTRYPMTPEKKITTRTIAAWLRIPPSPNPVSLRFVSQSRSFERHLLLLFVNVDSKLAPPPCRVSSLLLLRRILDGGERLRMAWADPSTRWFHLGRRRRIKQKQKKKKHKHDKTKRRQDSQKKHRSKIPRQCPDTRCTWLK